MSETSTTAPAADGGALPVPMVTIPRDQLALLVKAADLMLANYAGGWAVAEDELTEWGLADEREATDEDRELLADPDVETLIEPSAALYEAVTEGALMAGVSLGSIPQDDEPAPDLL